MKIRIATYSTVPRGDVVHALALAEGLAARGHDVELWALSLGGERLFRDSPVPVNIVEAGGAEGETDVQRVERGGAVLASALRTAGPADIHHAEDPLSAHALIALRDTGHVSAVVRTIHHVDAFTSAELLEWQRASIVDVDHRLCVSQHWATRVEQEFGVGAIVVANGVDSARFSAVASSRAEAGGRFGWGSRPVVLAVGGIEPRKGSRLLLEAFARARGRLGDDALLAIAGGGGLFDAPDYQDAWWRDADRLGLTVHTGRTESVPAFANVVVLGVVPESEMPELYRAADVLAFPSTREGFGLVVLEAVAAGIPAVVTDLPVLQEHLRDGRDCLMVPAGSSGPLANAIVIAARDQALRDHLRQGGAATVARFTWENCAAEHESVYERIRAGRLVRPV